MVTASSTVDDLMYALVQRQVIPFDCGAVHMLSYARVGSLRGSVTMASLGAGSLSHFHLRARVCGGPRK